MGKTVQIKGKEKQLGKNTFIEAVDVEFLDREAYPEDVVNDTVSFDALVKFISPEEFKRLHLGLDEDGNEPVGDEPDNEDRKPPRRRGPSTSSSGPGSSSASESLKEPDDDLPPWVQGECPSGLEFGQPDMDSDKCKECHEDVFDSCVAKADEGQVDEKVKDAVAKDPDPEPEVAQKRRRVRK